VPINAHLGPLIYTYPIGFYRAQSSAPSQHPSTRGSSKVICQRTEKCACHTRRQLTLRCDKPTCGMKPVSPNPLHLTQISNTSGAYYIYTYIIRLSVTTLRRRKFRILSEIGFHEIQLSEIRHEIKRILRRSVVRFQRQNYLNKNIFLNKKNVEEIFMYRLHSLVISNTINDKCAMISVLLSFSSIIINDVSTNQRNKK